LKLDLYESQINIKNDFSIMIFLKILKIDQPYFALNVEHTS